MNEQPAHAVVVVEGFSVVGVVVVVVLVVVEDVVVVDVVVGVQYVYPSSPKYNEPQSHGYLRHKGSTEDYINSTEHRIKTIVKDCKFVRMDQISASRVQAFLSDLRASGRSVGSSNHYLRAIKMFTRWLVKDRRSPEDRLMHLSKMNVEAHRCRVRRPLSMEEFVKLLKATQDGPTIQNVSGPDRAILYTLAAYTGYRRNEIGSVTMRSFDFESDPPTLTVEAAHSKHRQRDVLPLRADFAAQIKDWINSKKRPHPDLPLFDITDKHTAEMIRKDLKRAGIPYIDDRGHYADFHALRKTFITNLSRAGVSPKTAQLLARHSDINLTMNTYTMLGVCDQASAVESLPPVPQVAAAATPRDENTMSTLADCPRPECHDTAA